jgi:hypothetical protein
VNQSARQMLAGLPVRMAEGGAVEDQLSAGRRRAIANGNEAGWLQNVAGVANKWFSSPGTAAEAYDGLVKSGISVKDLRDAGISQDAIDKALSIPTSEAQKQVNALTTKALTTTLSQNPTLASEIGARGASAIYAQANAFVENLQKDGLTDAERQQLQQVATQQGWGFADIRAAGIDPNILFKAPAAAAPVVPPPVVPPPVVPPPVVPPPLTGGVTQDDLVGAVNNDGARSYDRDDLREIIREAEAQPAALGTVTNPIDTRGSAATGSQSGVTDFLETYVAPTPFTPAAPYVAPTVYDPEKFARENAGADLYGRGQTALDTAFRSSPVRQVSPTTGQYTYTPAAQLRPATGSGFSFTPPVVTSRPRQLLDVGPTASASQQYAQDRQSQDRALRDAFSASNLPMSGANTYYWQSRLRGGDYSPGGTFDTAKFGQDFQSWAASQGSGTSGTAGSSQTGGAIEQNQQMYDEFGNPISSQTANPLAMAPKMFLGMQPQMFADGGEAKARELLDRLKKSEGAEEQVPGAEEPGFLDQIAQKARLLSRKLSDLTPMSEMEDYASRTSTLFYPKETELGGEADAMRHMLFQSELANRYGRLPAAVVGALNEYGLGTLQGQSRAERGMDLENDEKGRDIGLSDMTQDERLREIMEFIDSGKAKTLKESQLGYKDGGEVSTEELIAQMDRIGSAPMPKAPEEEPEQTESRSMLRRISDTFGQNVTAPVVGSLVDMTFGMGDIAQLGLKAGAKKLGMETEPFTPVSPRIQEALGTAGYDPYAPAAIAAQIGVPALSRVRAAAAPALSAASQLNALTPNEQLIIRGLGGIGEEGMIYAGAEGGAQIAREVAPDNIGAELIGSMLGGTVVNTAIALDPRDMSRSAGVTNMASYNSDVGSYSPYPFARGREYPFVGRLDQYVADKVEGTLTKDQFLGQIRPKFREYDILRAERALSDLGGKDKLTAADLLTRLEQVYDPADFKMSVYKQGNLSYNSIDNPWSGGISGNSSATGRFGTISLSRGGVEGSASPSINPNRLNQGRDILQQFTGSRALVADSFSRGENLGQISILRDIVNELPDSTEQNRLRSYISALKDAVRQRQSIANELDVLQEDNEYLLKVATRPSFFEPAMREALERGGAPPEQLLDQAFNTAISRAYASQMQYLPAYDEFFPLDIDLTGAVSYDDKVQAIASQIGPAAARAKQQLQAYTADRLNNTLTAMEGYAPEFEKLFKAGTSSIPGSNPGFKGQHPELSASAGNQIGFSRFSEVEAPLPGGTAAARGIYVHELQADLLDDIRKKGMRGEGVPELEQRLQRAMQEKDKATLAADQAQSELDMLSGYYGSSYERELAGDISAAQGAADRAAFDQQSQPLIEQLQSSQNRAFSVGSRIAELEDAVRNAKKGKMPDLDESFPGMERNSKAVQQLLIRNAVAAAVDQNYQFVALTAPEHSSQPQLYSRIAKNASDVVKDLGEGFRVVDLTLEGSGGPFKTTAIVWGDDSAEGREAVQRVLNRGIPFAKGGEVTSKPDDIKNLLSFLDK